MSQGYRYIPGICCSQGFVAMICPRIISRDVSQEYVPVCFVGICPRYMLPGYQYIPGICWSQDLLQWYVSELFEEMCPKDMSQGYVVEICPWDILQGYVLEICSRDMSQRYVPAICFRDNNSRARTVLTSPWILGEVLGKSLNFCASPWKVLEFSSTLNVVAWKVFLILFGCLKQCINHNWENLKVICIKCSMFYVIIDYQFKTSELKNVETLVKRTVQALKSH